MQRAINVEKLALVFCVLRVPLNIGGGTMKEVINRIIEDFNFEKVHQAMQTLNWGWLCTDMKVPSVGSLMACAQELLQDVSKMDVECSISTGGFRATKIAGEDIGEGLELEFVLTSEMWCTKWLDEE